MGSLRNVLLKRWQERGGPGGSTEERKKRLREDERRWNKRGMQEGKKRLKEGGIRGGRKR